MRSFLAYLLVTLAMATGYSLTATATASAHSSSYRGQVIMGTRFYGPCVEMMRTKAGRIMYRDMISDTYDDGHKRTVKAQVAYVRQGCRNGA